MAYVYNSTDGPNIKIFSFPMSEYVACGGSANDSLTTASNNVIAGFQAAGTGGACKLCGGSGRVDKSKVTLNPSDTGITIDCPPASENSQSGCNGKGYMITTQTAVMKITGGANI